MARYLYIIEVKVVVCECLGVRGLILTTPSVSHIFNENVQFLQGFTKLSQTEYVIEELDVEREKGKRKLKGARKEFKVLYDIFTTVNENPPQ